jgi:hypothetical protein
MNRQWQFTDVEFVALWEQTRLGPVPDPLVFLSRTPLYDDYRREKEQARTRLSSQLDESFAGVLDALAEPDIRLRVNAWGGHDPHDPDCRIRMLAVRRGSCGYLVDQLGAETIWHSGGYIVTECDAVHVADAVVDALPDTEPGSRPEVELPAGPGGSAELDYDYGQSVCSTDGYGTMEQRSYQFLNAPVTRIGRIDILQGRSKYGPRGITPHTVHWRDHADDGRYAIVPGLPPRAVAMHSAGFTTTINAAIAQVVRAIRDEHGH